ncbi:hypothetical protein AB6A40_003595 [Gnathostoma spinigerum]|uniref:Galectin n=1 Tax=Gnathostoma spinigerum TaxID=75299 RepID=A0ABD6EHM2_9BILA
MYIDGYNGKKPARFIFKSNDKTGNVPSFMTMFLWKEYTSMNEKKDGRWCPNDIRVKNKINSGEWHMQFKVRMWNGKQQFDIQFLNPKSDTIFRFHSQTHIKRGDWFIFYEDYYYILGISWSRVGNVQFKTSPVPESRIVIHGKLVRRAPFDIFLKNENGAVKIQITGNLGSSPSFSSPSPGKNYISGYNRQVTCWKYPFTTPKTIVVVIEVMQRGIKYYGDGYYVCTFESNEFKRNDISRIDVGGSLEVHGYGANTCDYYR